MFDSTGRLVIANAASGKLLGRSDLTTLKISIDDLFDEFNEGLGADIRDVLATGHPLEPVMTEYALPDGGWQPIKLSAQALTKSGGIKGV